MRTRKVEFSPEARADFFDLYDWIAEAAAPDIALEFVGRLEAYCEGFETAAERGHRRDDLRAGLRIVGFERRVTVAFTVDDRTVTILRLFYAGRDWERMPFDV